jgi:tight adherence protein B
MAAQHGEDGYIILELKIINAEIAGNENIELLLKDLGERSGIEDIKSFANVFETCYRLGGNIKDVVSMTCQVIRDKIDTRQEIRTVVSAKESNKTLCL